MQFFLGLLLALGLVAAAFAQEVEEGVLVLTDANFDAVSASVHRLWLLLRKACVYYGHNFIITAVKILDGMPVLLNSQSV
jgi:hypothetical protein